MNTEKLRVLIVDDELLAREHLKELLLTLPYLEISGEAENGLDAIKSIQETAPDIVFLDVQMPGMNGIDVLKSLDPSTLPIVIFVTAYDHYALRAFDLAAVDYLLKPFDDERLEKSVQRARKLHELKQSKETANHIRKTLEYLSTNYADVERPPAANPPLARIAIESRGQVRIVLTEEIDYITASGVYAELHVGQKTHVVRERMQVLEGKLDSQMFFRIHRSIIVQLNRIDVLLRQAGGDYNLRLKNGTTLPVSRNRIDELETWMGVPKNSRQETVRSADDVK